MTKVFLSVLGVSVSVSVMIAVLLLLTPFLNRRYAAKWKYWIWAVLALRLILPFAGNSRQPAANMMPYEELQNMAGAEKEDMDTLTDRTSPGKIIVEIPAQLTTPIAPRIEKTGRHITLLDAAAFVWALGGLLFTAVHLFSYFRYKRQILKNGKMVKDGEALCLLSELKRELHIRETVSVMEYADALSPMIIGFWKHILVLPEERYKADELYFIMKHELVHMKHRDMYFKLLFVMANAIHWFNPFVWILQKEAAVDIELSCDERVTQGTEYAVKKAYTETLLSTLHRQCAANKKYKKKTILSTQFYGGKRIMKKRFKNILIKAGKKNGIVLLLCSIILTVSQGTLKGCTTKHENVVETPGPAESEEVRGDASLSESGSTAPGEEQPLDDRSVFIGDLTLSLYEVKEDMLAKLKEAGLDYTELKPDDPEEAKYNSCYAVDAWMQIYFLDDVCVRLRLIGTDFENLSETPQTARGIHPGSTYSQMVEQYGEPYESHKQVGTEVYGLCRYSLDDRISCICEFGIPGEKSDSIYYVDLYDISQFPVYDYGEYLESMEQNDGKVLNSGWPMHIDVTPPSLQEDMSLGADFVILDYADENIVIFHGYFGLFVYDKEKKELAGAVDLAAIGCDSTQGDDYCEIWVKEDGSRVYMSPITSNMMYVYNVTEQSLVMEPFDISGIEMFDSFIDPRDPEYMGIITSGRDIEGFMSFRGAAVAGSDGRIRYGYLLSLDTVGSVLYEEVGYLGEGSYEYEDYQIFE